MKTNRMKKMASFALSLALLLSITPLQSVSAATYTLGDVNADGKIDSADAQLILKGGLGGDSLLAGDVNQDGQVNTTDADHLLDYITGKKSVSKATVTVNKSNLSLAKGKSEQLIPTVTTTGTLKTVSWKSSAPSIATVSSDGTVTAVANGSTTITAQLFNGEFAICNVTVTTPIKKQYFGIDVSKHNGAINWSSVANSKLNNVDANSGVKLSDSVDFAILRSGYGMASMNQKDIKFDEYYRGAKAKNIPVGAYHVLYAENIADVKKEAILCANILQGYSLDYPIFYDIEDFGGDSTDLSGISKTELSEMAIAFCDYMQKQGYYVGVYSSASWFYSNKTPSSTNVESRLSLSTIRNRLGDVPVWVANYPNGGYRTTGIPTYWNTNVDWDMWQFASNGVISGVPSSGVDLNVSNVDFSKAVRDGGYNRAQKNTAKAAVISGAAGSIYSNELIQ